ncbi:2-dehydro-3-deoxy-D-gluconate 5-dehydrogenase KduD [Marinimicrobium sp. ARAG 43.8]|uniref:2-dehydro-3-deoxy-D-gluconate 5-dehydrogenase KduD n=1 Tax=Marinimicrobium sp. ARAG 43.8 TaxID=3418719 RepID=UPI003CF81E4D
MVLDKFKLEGRVAIVTGCNTGLGQAMAVALAEAGCDIVGLNFSEPTETKQYVEALGRGFENVHADLRKTDVIPTVIEAAVKRFGKLDILVNNAGTIRRSDAIDFNEQDWDDVINVNLRTVFFLCQAAARQFQRQNSGGKIINIASMLSFQGGVRVPAYTASKSAVMGLTKALANEWATLGVNVNAIAPGYMETSNTQALREDTQRSAEILGRIPSGRWGLPEDLKGPVVFLASDAADYVNGYTVAVDGGWLAR